MTVKDQLKILDRKIRQNKANYDLYRQNAEISALSSGDLNKYEYLTNKDLGYKPDPLQKAKFEYSPLGQVFNKGLTTDEKQVRLLKRLKNIEDKPNNQLTAIEDQENNQSGIKSIGFNIKKSLSPEGLKAYDEIVQKERSINYAYLYMKPSKKYKHDFREFKKSKELFEEIYYGRTRLPPIEIQQSIFEQKLEYLNNYAPRNEINSDNKNNILKNAKNFYEGREMIINAFKINCFYYILEIIMMSTKFQKLKNHQKVKKVKIVKNHQEVKTVKNHQKKKSMIHQQ